MTFSLVSVFFYCFSPRGRTPKERAGETARLGEHDGSGLSMYYLHWMVYYRLVLGNTRAGSVVYHCTYIY